MNSKSFEVPTLNGADLPYDAFLSNRCRDNFQRMQRSRKKPNYSLDTTPLYKCFFFFNQQTET